MGIVYSNLLVKKSFGDKNSIKIKFLIDSGAVFSLIPKDKLLNIGIKPHKTEKFFLADGTEIERKVGGAYFELKGVGGYAPVIFGEEGDEPLLGATTLESLGLVLNPFSRDLKPMRMLLA